MGWLLSGVRMRSIAPSGVAGPVPDRSVARCSAVPSESPVGRLVTQVDYADYRDVSGVRLPLKWTVSWLNGRSIYELRDVQTNVAIDAAKFARPGVKR